VVWVTILVGTDTEPTVTETNSFLIIREDLNAWDGTLIASAGEVITPHMFDEIRNQGLYRRTQSISVHDCGLIEAFEAAMNEDCYKIIFDTDEVRSKVLEVICDIPLTTDISQELRLFKATDYYTYRHILITTALSTVMALDLFQDRPLVSLAAFTALTHDFGKSRIPLRILQSSKKLSPQEYLYILEHPWVGFLLLTYYTGTSYSLNSQVALNHHEKNDGTGYPRGVTVHDPIVQLVTICDIYDALISPRSYRKFPYDVRGALDFLCDEAEKGRLNLQGVKLLISYNRGGKPAADSITISQSHSGYRPPDEKNHYSCREDYEETDLSDGVRQGV